MSGRRVKRTAVAGRPWRERPRALRWLSAATIVLCGLVIAYMVMGEPRSEPVPEWVNEASRAVAVIMMVLIVVGIAFRHRIWGETLRVIGIAIFCLMLLLNAVV